MPPGGTLPGGTLPGGAAVVVGGGGISIGSVVTAVVILIVGGVAAIVVATVVSGVLVLSGTPTPCVDREIPVSAAASQAFDDKWDAFHDQIKVAPSAVTFSETEVTSRGVDYLDDAGVPVDDVQIYLCPQGYGEMTGTMSLAGLDADVLIRGTVDVSGDDPSVDIDKIEAGNLPSFIATNLVNAVLDQGGVKTFETDDNLTSIVITDGSVTVAGAP